MDSKKYWVKTRKAEMPISCEAKLKIKEFRTCND